MSELFKTFNGDGKNQFREEGSIMAIPTNIKTLLSGEVVEWARIEFKETIMVQLSRQKSEIFIMN